MSRKMIGMGPEGPIWEEAPAPEPAPEPEPTPEPEPRRLELVASWHTLRGGDDYYRDVATGEIFSRTSGWCVQGMDEEDLWSKEDEGIPPQATPVAKDSYDYEVLEMYIFQD